MYFRTSSALFLCLRLLLIPAAAAALSSSLRIQTFAFAGSAQLAVINCCLMLISARGKEKIETTGSRAAPDVSSAILVAVLVSMPLIFDNNRG